MEQGEASSFICAGVVHASANGATMATSVLITNSYLIRVDGTSPILPVASSLSRQRAPTLGVRVKISVMDAWQQ